MLKNTWTDSPHKIASLIDRQPIEEADDIIVIAAPDPLGKCPFPSCQDTARLQLCAWVAVQSREKPNLIALFPANTQ